ncbi:FMN reductase [Zafaria sp. Z1313]|uniref:FMN reductase n=1 Tax=Zafaria sp. Z1313 TaxID=3423202 RepID=UPI003D3022DE
MSAHIVVLSGGLGVPSTSRMLGDQLAASTLRALSGRGIEAAVEVVELREHAVDIATMMLTRFPSPRLAEAIERVLAADAVIAVSPVFTASVSGLFKSFLDVLDPQALAGKPVLLAATGGSSRHSMVLDHVMRPVFSYLRADVAPTGVFAAPEDWGGDTGEGPLSARGDRAGRELADAVARNLGQAQAQAQAQGAAAAGTGSAGQAAGTTPDVGPGAEPASARGSSGAGPMQSLPFEQLLADIQGR